MVEVDASTRAVILKRELSISGITISQKAKADLVFLVHIRSGVLICFQMMKEESQKY